MSAISNVALEARERLINEAATDNFAELIRIAGLDPKKHLRFADWSGVDFSGSDLRGFDFTGARLIGCNFKGAWIEGARFDQALIDEARPSAKLDLNRTDLRAAEDWERYVWKRAERPAPEHLPPGAVFQDSPFTPEMVVIPPGRFWMGSKDDEGFESERPRHEVTIPYALAVGRFPLIWKEWDAARDGGAVEPKPSGEGWSRGRYPVTAVSWHDAQAYVAWLSSKTGKPYRLLSEAEWEYACRAGSETAYSFGKTISKAQAQFSEGRWGSAGATVEVGSFPANNFGLRDMPGNVWEWCEDCWHASYAGKPESLKQTGGAGQSKVVTFAFSVAAPGSAIQETSAPRNATGTSQRAGTTISVSVWPGRSSPLESLAPYLRRSLLLGFRRLAPSRAAKAAKGCAARSH